MVAPPFAAAATRPLLLTLAVPEALELQTRPAALTAFPFASNAASCTVAPSDASVVEACAVTCETCCATATSKVDVLTAPPSAVCPVIRALPFLFALTRPAALTSATVAAEHGGDAVPSQETKVTPPGIACAFASSAISFTVAPRLARVVGAPAARSEAICCATLTASVPSFPLALAVIVALPFPITVMVAFGLPAAPGVTCTTVLSLELQVYETPESCPPLESNAFAVSVCVCPIAVKGPAPIEPVIVTRAAA